MDWSSLPCGPRPTPYVSQKKYAKERVETAEQALKAKEAEGAENNENSEQSEIRILGKLLESPLEAKAVAQRQDVMRGMRKG